MKRLSFRLIKCTTRTTVVHLTQTAALVENYILGDELEKSEDAM